MKYKLGFTLIEILLVLGILIILSGVVLQVINPLSLFANSRNAERQAHLTSLITAVSQRIAGNKGTWNAVCGTKTVTLPTSTKNIGADTGRVDLASCLVPTYLSGMFYDPSAGNASDTNYQIFQDATTTRITLTAPNAELGQTISVTR